MNKKKYLIVVGMIAIVLLVRVIDIQDTISIETLIENKDRLIQFTGRHHLSSGIIFLISNIILGAVGVPVFAVFTLAAGLMFGFLEGLVLSIVGAIVGGYVSFFLSRYAFSSFFQKRYEHRLRKVKDKLENKEFLYLLGLRLLPGFPYFITNILAGLSRIKTSSFIYSTLLGIMPSTLLFIYTGHILRKVDSVYQMLSLQYLWPIIGVALMTIVAVFLRLKKNKII